MFGSSASWKPRRESVSMQTGTERSFEYVASSGESLRRYETWYALGTAGRCGPSKASNHRSRSRA